MAFANPRLMGICAIGVLAIGVTWFYTRGSSKPPRVDARNIPLSPFDGSTNVKELQKGVRDANPQAAASALVNLARVNPEAARPLVQEMLSDPRGPVRAAAVTAMGHLTDRQNVGDLTKAVADPDPEVQAAAAKALGQLKPWEGLEPLTGALNDKNIFVRRCAISAIESTLGVRFSDYKADADPAARTKAIEHIRVAIPKLKNAHENFLRREEKKGSKP